MEGAAFRGCFILRQRDADALLVDSIANLSYGLGIINCFDARARARKRHFEAHLIILQVV